MTGRFSGVSDRPKVIALVLAGGLGSRMGRPKQFIDLLGRPALAYTLDAFERSPEVGRIYAVGDARRVSELAYAGGISKYAGCALPGESRSHSTKNGLALLGEEPSDSVVLVHDGCRCLVSETLIGRVAGSLDGAEGVIPAVPVSDTIKTADANGDGDEFVARTVDRSNLRAVQTPQGFRLEVLREIFSSSEELLDSATDDASLIERTGGRVRIVRGEKDNIKLTTPEDLILAEAILRSRSRLHRARDAFKREARR
ncbi:2-C-methyl-D-erythritol 4-phosphate cytidylyltransferase [Rubrobacter indicoceani]|uniref:2-C-methyl-D-erythritol 4-phosphate cytidylyltransferase n=1 Tax=Rubrobacter indicoceani TaxID=2051957 RepID=UPI000E5B72F4|nr:2-C-methyl-D-erythritol 4-phosphate cytidylyltransferase [Rubrobacter indicoceani]